MEKPVPVLAAATLIAVVAAVYFWQQLGAARAQSAALRARVTGLEAARGATHPPLPASQAGAAGREPPANVPQTPTGQTGAPVPATAAKDAHGRPAQAVNLQELLKDPDYREGMRAQLRAALPQNFPDLARELGLTPEEAAAFFDLLAKQQISTTADVISTGAAEHPDAATMRELQRVAAERQRAQQAEVVALLGDAKAQQWQSYQDSLPARQRVNRLQAALASGGDALSDAQARPLIAAITAGQKQLNEEARVTAARTAGDPADPEEMIRRQDQANRRLLDVAASYLTSPQLQRFGTLLDQETGMQRALLRALTPGQGQPSAGTVVIPALPAP